VSHLGWLDLERLEELQGRHRLSTVAIITTESNESMAAIHDRQPAILEPREYEEWLAPSERPPLHLLRVLPSEEMDIRLMETHNMQLPLNST